MKSILSWTALSLGLTGAFLAIGTVAPVTRVVAQNTAFATAPCTDSEGTTTAFFCQPLSTKGKLVAACSQKKPKDLAACQMAGASSYCSARGYARHVSYNMDAKGNLTELVCSRAAVMSVAAATSAPPVDDAKWQPLYNANIFGFDYREFRVADRNDWRSCKAACDADNRCKAWTQVPNYDSCYLKTTGDANLLSNDECCITGIKGMASAGGGAAEQRRTVRTPEELKRLGRRTQTAAEDEVGRRAEDAVRRGIGEIFNK